MADVRIQQYPLKSIVSDNDIFLIADSNDVDVNGFLKYKKVRAKDLPSIVNTAESITYANLMASIAADDLIIGTFYKITDSTSGVSPLLVQAIGIDAIGYQAFDGANPLNTINYDVTTDTIRWNSNQSVAPVPSTRTLTAGTGLTGGGDLTANRTFAIDSTVATLTGTQTLTNKTITSPVINEILDSNGNEILGFTPIASATDYITIKNGIGVGVPLHISAAGSSTNTGLHLEPKGTGLVQISDGTDTTKGIRFRSSGSAASAVTLLDAVSSAGRVITLPDATTTLVGTNTTDTLTNKSIAGDTNTLSNIGNASLTNSAITINGTSTSLGGSINVGTVTSVAALTLGTSGTDLTSTVATGTTTPVITLNVPTASASNRGALSSTDWSTFNAKQNAITLTTTGTSGAATLVGSTLNIPNYADTDTGITSLNGLTALTQTFAVGTSGTDFDISSATSTHTFNLPTASAANRGALSSADWTTFNNKASTADLANYLPLAGGTLTGALNGTSGVFSSSITSNSNTNGQIAISPASNISAAAFTASNAGGGCYFGKNNSTGGAFTGAAYATVVYSGGDLPMSFYTNDAERMRLFGDGNLALGSTTNAGYKLDVNGTARVQGNFKVGSASGSTATPTAIQMDDTFQATTPSFNSLKFYLYKDATQSYGFGLGNDADVQYWAGDSSTGIHKFFTSQTERMRLIANGNLLLGTTTDAGYKLDVNGTARVQGQLAVNHSLSGNYGAIVYNTSATGEGLVVRGGSTVSHTSFAVQPYDGSVALFSVVATGAATFSADATINGVKVGRGGGNIADNTAVGVTALNANTIGTNNVAVGVRAMISNTIGLQNSAFGGDALGSNTTGNYNSAFGQGAMYGNLTGSNNSAFGQNALVNNTASNNCGFGFEAAFSNTSGANIVALGYQALRANTTGIRNIAVGSGALNANTTANYNNSFGFATLRDNTTGNGNSAFGDSTLGLNTTGSSNAAFGGFDGATNPALYANTTGSSNCAFGIGSLTANTTGSNNTAIGFSTESGDFSGSVILGRQATATGNNQFVVGSAAVNAGAVATEVLVSDRSWAVKINGVDYKILLKA